VAAGWIAILAGFAALFIGRPARSGDARASSEPVAA
jgi:hypothetical protein